MRKLWCIALLLVLTACVYAQSNRQSPTWDVEPPSYVWGSGTIKPQQTGAPVETEHKIIANISVDTKNIDKGVATLSLNLNKIDSRLHTKDSDVDKDISVLSLEIKENIVSGTSAIVEAVASYSGATIASVSVDTSDIKAMLTATDTYASDTILNVAQANIEIKHNTSEIASKTNAIYQILNNNYTPTVVTDMNVRRITVDAGETIAVETDIAKRLFVEIRALSEDTVFNVSFDEVESYSESRSRPVKGRVMLSYGSEGNLTVHNPNESSITLCVTEGWCSNE